MTGMTATMALSLSLADRVAQNGLTRLLETKGDTGQETTTANRRLPIDPANGCEAAESSCNNPCCNKEAR